MVSIDRSSRGEGLGRARCRRGVADWHALRFDCVSLGFVFLPLYKSELFYFIVDALTDAPHPPPSEFWFCLANCYVLHYITQLQLTFSTPHLEGK